MAQNEEVNDDSPSLGQLFEKLAQSVGVSPNRLIERLAPPADLTVVMKVKGVMEVELAGEPAAVVEALSTTTLHTVLTSAVQLRCQLELNVCRLEHAEDNKAKEP